MVRLLLTARLSRHKARLPSRRDARVGPAHYDDSPITLARSGSTPHSAFLRATFIMWGDGACVPSGRRKGVRQMPVDLLNLRPGEGTVRGDHLKRLLRPEHLNMPRRERTAQQGPARVDEAEHAAHLV